MNKLRVVARHEYLFHVRRKGFLLATFGMPLLMIVLFVLLIVLSIRAERAEALGYVDQSGVLSQMGPKTVVSGAVGDPVTATRYPNAAAAQAALEAGAIEVYFVVQPDYLQTGAVTAYAQRRVPQLARQRFTTLLYHALLRQLPAQDPRIEEPIVSTERLTSQGQPNKAGSALIFPMVYGFMLLIATFSSGSYLMQSLVEEKENRVMEVLATSLPPGKLMGGKILGLGLLGLTQMGIWLSCLLLLLVAALLLGLPLSSLNLPWGELGLMGLLFIPSYLLFAASLCAVGTAVTATQEGQQLASIFTLMTISPAWFGVVLVDSPHSPLALGLTFFPYTAPLALLLRRSATEVPAWQVVGALLVLVGSALGMVWVAGRVMRFGMLRYGKRIGLRELGRALRGR